MRMDICCRCYRYNKKREIPLHSDSFCFLLFFHFHQLSFWKHFFFVSNVTFELREKKEKEIPNIVLRHTYIQTFIHLYRIADKNEKNFAMNGKADVFFCSILFLCSILCIYSLMPLFSLPFRVVFVSLYFSLVRFIRDVFFMFGWHTHTHTV